MIFRMEAFASNRDQVSALELAQEVNLCVNSES